MPIFAQSLMFVPAAVSGLNKNSEAATLIGVSGSSPTTGCITGYRLIVIFTYFYTAISVSIPTRLRMT
jgi:preprotein translocase subunit SecY